MKNPGARRQVGNYRRYIWLLQKVDADRVFMVFGQDAEVAERYLAPVRALTAPVEFYFLDGSGHQRI